MQRTSLALLAAAAVAGCGGKAGPPRGPEYDPVNTPDAETPCADEQQAAQPAREDHLEQPSAATREAAAAAVFAHAECEAAAFAKAELGGQTQDEMFARIRSARPRYDSARNLYEEALGYGVPEYLHAGARLGELHLAFANKLERAGVPPEIADPGQRQVFAAEIASLTAELEQRAADAYRRALAAAAASTEVGSDPPDPTWTVPACVALGELDPAAPGGLVLCER